MDKILAFDLNRCTGCRLCELICSLVHTKTCNPERSRIRVLRMEEKGVDLPVFCQEQECEDAACIGACPVSAINRNESTQAIEIDYESCSKCKDCIIECPYKGIYFDSVDDRIIKCDLCGGDPKCVMFCETKALEFLEKDTGAIQKKRDALRELESLLKLAEDN